jgi:hypothetical protein
MVVAEIIKQQERVQLAWILKPKSAVQMYASAFHGWLG